MSPSEEDSSSIASLTGRALEEELSTLACYTQHASNALAIGGADIWNAFLPYQKHKGKQQLDESICSLTLHRDTYLLKVHKAPACLTRVGGALHALNLPDSLLE